MRGVTSEERAVLERAAGEPMLDQVQAWAAVNSGSRNLAGLAEMARLGAAMGGAAETFFGLAGAGDLILTATGDLSRNRRVGLELAHGRPLGDILANLGHVAEGVHSAREVARLAKAKGVELPVSDAVNAVLEGRLTAAAAVESLLARDPKQER